MHQQMGERRITRGPGMKRLGCIGRLVCEAATARKTGLRPNLSTYTSILSLTTQAGSFVRPNELSRAPVNSIHCPNNKGRPQDASQMINEMTKTFYRKPLPDHLISFTSPEGREIFKEALSAGTLENYFDLVGNFAHQTESACTKCMCIVLRFIFGNRLWTWVLGDGAECLRGGSGKDLEGSLAVVLG